MKKVSGLSPWKLFSVIGFFCGSLLLLLYNDKIQDNRSFLAAKSAMEELAPNVTLLAPPTTITKLIFPTNFTNIYPTHKPNNVTLSIIKNPAPKSKTAKCDMFDGRWVYSSEEKPSYNAMTCPFMDITTSCQKNGRPDFEYQKWRWEARDCDIPLFDGKDMLERLRNKRMIIVGDSINRNMWESLACLLYSIVPSSKAEIVDKKAYKGLVAKDFNFTVEFTMSPFLVDLDKNHESGRKVLVLDKISPYSKQWSGANIMVFNSAHWWTHGNKIKAWDLFQYKGKLIEEMPRDLAYKRGMRTWASWIKKNVDPKQTNVFFRSLSPTHSSQKYDQWCYNVTLPKMEESYISSFPKTFVVVIETLIKGMSKFGVRYLNITELSQFRIDAHPSIYTMELNTLTKQYNDDHLRHVDCSHWCLPGLPDTWNRLLYASILFDNIPGNMPRS
ncbi:hypothetical protein BVRB_9g225250 [Beta vulgaris subsp. vulgaris]|uniref:Uncharacterized protein n=1 Tax=Beta vulgaris subsp. vulgaris TaxID=3555 RepID=A0A0J8DZY8_BETVV|nr:hypothetical protein BVRB_9g225250 [Beta vulgaris subsp. vulgaris]